MIATERLTLRPWRETDKPVFAERLNSPAMMRHMGGVMNRQAVDSLIDRQIAMQRAHGFSFWAMENRSEGYLIGTCGLRLGGHAETLVGDELEIGWRVAESHWGMGFAREAAAASIAWGWRHTARPRIAAWTVPGNTRSWGLMLRLGMTPRPDLDFDHPAFAEGHALRRHLVYAIDRPAVLSRSDF